MNEVSKTTKITVVKVSLLIKVCNIGRMLHKQLLNLLLHAPSAQCAAPYVTDYGSVGAQGDVFLTSVVRGGQCSVSRFGRFSPWQTVPLHVT
jgi:hypothetical protein